MHPWGNAILSRGTPNKLLTSADNISLKIGLIDQGKVAYTKTISANVFQERTWINEKLEINNPELWWPNGMGDPNLYDVQLTLMEN